MPKINTTCAINLDDVTIEHGILVKCTPANNTPILYFIKDQSTLDKLASCPLTRHKRYYQFFHLSSLPKSIHNQLQGVSKNVLENTQSLIKIFPETSGVWQKGRFLSPLARKLRDDSINPHDIIAMRRVNCPRNDKGLVEAALDHLNLPEWSLDSLDMSDADFSYSHLEQVSFVEANLKNANLTKTNLHGANLSKANLEGANFSRTDLSFSDLRGAIFDDKTNFSNANLQGAKLSGRQFELLCKRTPRPNLTGINLSGQNLGTANLAGVDLSGADLTDANLSRVLNLNTAILNKAKLMAIMIPRDTVFFGGTVAGQREMIDQFTGGYQARRFIDKEKHAVTVTPFLRKFVAPIADFFMTNLIKTLKTKLDPLNEENASLYALLIKQHIDENPQSRSSAVFNDLTSQTQTPSP